MCVYSTRRPAGSVALAKNARWHPKPRHKELLLYSHIHTHIYITTYIYIDVMFIYYRHYPPVAALNIWLCFLLRIFAASDFCSAADPFVFAHKHLPTPSVCLCFCPGFRLSL